MRAPLLALQAGAGLLLAQHVMADDPNQGTDQTDVPACGVLCTTQLVPKSECKTTANTTCVCANDQLNNDLAACITSSCTVREALSIRKSSDQLCQRPIHNSSGSAMIVTALFPSLAVLAFILRLAARHSSAASAWPPPWRLDDWALLPAVLGLAALASFCIVLNQQGIGLDMWFVTPYDRITQLLYLYYWGEMVYLVVIAVAKVSVLVFYLQVFPDRWSRRWSLGLVAGNVVYLVVFVFVTAFQCTPVDGAWRVWDGTYAASCRDVNAQAWAAAGVSIALDVGMLVLPMPALWKLQMGRRKKLQVMFMFGLGVFVLIVAVVRLQYLVIFAKTQNPTRDFVPLGIWSIVECSTSIICACLPAVRTILQKLAPKMLGSTNGGGTKTKASYALGSRLLSNALIANNNNNKDNNSIRVKSDFTVRSKRADERSFLELEPVGPQGFVDDGRGGRGRKLGDIDEAVVGVVGRDGLERTLSRQAGGTVTSVTAPTSARLVAGHRSRDFSGIARGAAG